MFAVQVLYLIEAVDEYCIQSLPEFEGKKFQNVAKEGIKLDATEKAKERKEALEKEFEPLLKWMKDDALKDKVGKCCLLDMGRQLQLAADAIMCILFFIHTNWELFSHGCLMFISLQSYLFGSHVVL